MAFPRRNTKVGYLDGSVSMTSTYANASQTILGSIGLKNVSVTQIIKLRWRLRSNIAIWTIWETRSTVSHGELQASSLPPMLVQTHANMYKALRCGITSCLYAAPKIPGCYLVRKPCQFHNDTVVSMLLRKAAAYRGTTTSCGAADNSMWRANYRKN